MVYNAQGTKCVKTVIFAYEFEQMSTVFFEHLPSYHRTQFLSLVTMCNDLRTSGPQVGYAIAMALERVKNTSYSESRRDNWSYLVYQYDLLLQRNEEIFHIPSKSMQQVRHYLQKRLRRTLS